MKKFLIASLLLISPIAFAEDVVVPVEDIDMKEVILTVNGEPMTTGEIISYRYNREGPALPNDPAELQNLLINELLTSMLLAQEAVKLGLDKEPIVEAEVAVARIGTLRKAALNSMLREQSVTDEEVKKAYDETYANAESKEFHARHILVDNEAKAKELIGKLDKDEDFVTLAKENSTGPTGPNGGDLGWIGADSVVKPFADALKLMEKGAHSEDPVETEYGWHVIKLEDVRKLDPPTLDEVKDELTSEIRVAKVRDYLAKLRDDAKIVVANPVEENTEEKK